MDMKRIIIGIWTAWLMLALASCHHFPEEESKENLDGTPQFSVEAFVRPGTVIEVTATGVRHPEGKGLGYFWVETIDNVIDTVRTPEDPASKLNTYQFAVKDTTGTFYLRCTAYADGYYVSSSSALFTVVKTGLGESLSGRGIAVDDPSFTDARDAGVPEGENVYYYTTIGDLDWMRNGLAYTGSGVAYQRCDVMNAVAGRFYTWEEASTACPEGWRLPTEAEWTEMIGTVTGVAYTPNTTLAGAAGALMGDAYFNGDKMWEFWPEVKITNSARLAFVPFGYSVVSGDEYAFSGTGSYSAFWTADSAPGNDSQAIYRYIYVKQPDVYLGIADKRSFGANVRCVRPKAL